MPSAKQLMRLHVETLFTLDDSGRLVSINERDGGAAPRVFLGRTAEGNAWWFRHELDPDLLDSLEAFCAALPARLDREADPGIAARLVDFFAREGPILKTWAGPAFFFPPDLPEHDAAILVTPDNATVLSPYLEAWRGDVAVGAPMAVALEGEKAVSVCCSVRVTGQAHEAGVETHPDFRGRGYAASAVATWARAVREMGRVPLYSTSWENLPSRAIARKLGLIQYGTDLHLT